MNGQVAGIRGVRLWGEMNLMEDSNDCICSPIYWFKMLATGLHEFWYLGSLCHLSLISYIVALNRNCENLGLSFWSMHW